MLGKGNLLPGQGSHKAKGHVSSTRKGWEGAGKGIGKGRWWVWGHKAGTRDGPTGGLRARVGRNPKGGRVGTNQAKVNQGKNCRWGENGTGRTTIGKAKGRKKKKGRQGKW